MKHLKKIGTILLSVVIAAFMIFSCEEKEHKKKKEKMEEKQSSANVVDPTDADSSACDPKLWDNVYNPSRLQVMDKCMTVTGTIEETNAEDDGDQHMLLKLDPSYENLINKRNKKKKNGDLVIEAV